VGHLRILARHDRLWTNQVNVTFGGESEESRIDYGKEEKASKENGTERLFAEPRDSPG